MKTKYTSVQLYATQGGGTAIREGNSYFFHDIPDWSSYIPGDTVPDEWDLIPIHRLYRQLPSVKQETESRNRREDTYQSRMSYFNKRRTVRRHQVKRARLAIKGTLRSTQRPRIDELFHRVGVEMAREERQAAKKTNQPVHFYRGDMLKVVNIEDCEEGLRLGDICYILDRTSETREFIVVSIRRNGKKKHLEKSRFILYSRYIDDEV